ncbi:MAG: glucuronate isomerase [Candidatus Ratteibacteria bacterium]|jgi:glucuronate isomerase
MNQKPFMNEDFCLETKEARILYHEYAEPMPIIDYHCHIPIEEIATNHRFENLFKIWLAGDHYKWRAMRINGVAERFITGNASDWEKFEKWAETVPATIRNPLYHWTHLELKKPFGITDRLLSPSTSRSIWDECNKKLASDEFSVQNIMKQWNVRLVCTTDDPSLPLTYHEILQKNQTCEIQICPSFRPDTGMYPEHSKLFYQWISQLKETLQKEISSWEEYLEALQLRIEAFHNLGCRISDHGIEKPYVEEYTYKEIEKIFLNALMQRPITLQEARKFRSAMLFELGCMYSKKSWTQQYHFGVIRNVNSKMMNTLGPNTGFDTIGDFEIAQPLALLLDRLDTHDNLPKTILYTVNPSDNEVLATMAGSFQSEGVSGKIQFGSAWWFLDQKDGMEKQIEALSNMGLLSRFIGMLTDSRSFLSYSRHEYFRRVLCNILGNDIAKGLLPTDFNLIGNMVRDISYRNAVSYFGFDLDT